MRFQELGELPAVRGVVVLLTFGLFLYTLGPVLSPFILFLLLLLVLHPYAGTRFHTAIVVAATLLTLLWILETTGFLLAPFVLSLVLAYILDPAVDVLERRLPRSVAILVLAVPIIGLLAAGLFIGLPALAQQLEDLIARFPVLLERSLAWVEGTRARLLAMDLPMIREDLLVERLRAVDSEAVVEFLQERQEELAANMWSAVLGLGRGLGTLLTIFGYVVLTPVLTFYILRDYDRARAGLVDLFPRARRDAWVEFLSEYDRLVSRYLRGQVLAATAVGVLTGVGLWIVDFPYSGLVGTVAGVFNLVPYLGLVVSLIPALAIALLSGNVLASLLKVAVVFGVVQFLDGSVIGPRVVGGSVGLHPVWVILALAVGGFFFGFVGLLLAVPVSVLIKLLVARSLARYRRSRTFAGSNGVSES